MSYFIEIPLESFTAVNKYAQLFTLLICANGKSVQISERK